MYNAINRGLYRGYSPRDKRSFRSSLMSLGDEALLIYYWSARAQTRQCLARNRETREQ